MLKTNEDDLFRESTMTFGEHLEELRVRLFRAALWLVIGVVIGFIIGDRVVRFIQTPLTQALESYVRKWSDKKLKDKYGSSLTPEQSSLVADGHIPDTIQIEPNKVINSLAGSDPDLSRLAPHVSEYRFTAADAPNGNVKALAMALASAATDESAKTPARRLWQKLDQAGREAAKKLAGSTDEAPAPEQSAALVEAVNRALSDRDLYDDAYFSGVRLPDKVAESLKTKDKLTTDDLRRTNWSLLSAALPDYFVEPHPFLVSLTIWRPASEGTQTQLIAMNAMEAFMIYLKAAMLTGFILFSPLIFRELWMFVASGLYPHERRYVYIFLPFSVGLFIAGCAMAFFLAFPPVLDFLFSYNLSLNIAPEPRISEWMSFALFLPLMFGVAFQLPLVMLFLNRIGMISTEAYKKRWRISVLVIAIAAAVLDPSNDPYSMTLMAASMVALFFLGIGLCMFASHRKPRGLDES
jgi:sec-independent protein translocase protein TatC